MTTNQTFVLASQSVNQTSSSVVPYSGKHEAEGATRLQNEIKFISLDMTHERREIRKAMERAKIEYGEVFNKLSVS